MGWKYIPSELFHGFPVGHSNLDQEKLTGLIDKIEDPSTKAMLRQAEPSGIEQWCINRIKARKRDLDSDAVVRANWSGPENVEKQPTRNPMNTIHYGLTDAQIVQLLTYARKGIRYIDPKSLNRAKDARRINSPSDVRQYNRKYRR